MREACTCLFVSISAEWGQCQFIPPRAAATSNRHKCCDARFQLWQRGWWYYGQQCWKAEAALLRPLLTEKYNSGWRDFQESLCHIIGKLLDLVLWFFTFKCIVSGNEGTCDSDGNMSPGNTNTVNGEKTIWCQQKYIVQTNSWDSSWPNTTAVICLLLPLDSSKSEQLKLQ